jgi:RNA polymerase sigma factor
VNNELFEMKNRTKLIEDNKNFIFQTTQRVCKRSISWENDEELSVSLLAFNKACDTYSSNKGEFLSYAKVIIKNSLIDYFRKNSNVPYVIFDENNEQSDYIDNNLSLKQYSLEIENSARLEEIAQLSDELKNYKLDFNILVDSSPSHKDTRNTLLNIAFTCIQNENIINHLKNKKLLPVKEICLLTGANRKMIEKWRRYILSLIIVFSNPEYPYIRSYLNIKVGDNND